MKLQSVFVRGWAGGAGGSMARMEAAEAHGRSVAEEREKEKKKGSAKKERKGEDTYRNGTHRCSEGAGASNAGVGAE